ncbi:MAG: hypothetical protein P4K83_12880 [Terracidiphilus sp.]|nr:hypothetical protein [Terracidiphilus sp.]
MAVVETGYFKPMDTYGVTGFVAAALALAGVIADVCQDRGQGKGSGESRESVFEVSFPHAARHTARIHVHRTEGCTGRSLFFNTLRFPLAYLLSIHRQIPKMRHLERSRLR